MSDFTKASSFPVMKDAKELEYTCSNVSESEEDGTLLPDLGFIEMLMKKGYLTIHRHPDRDALIYRIKVFK